MMAGSGLLLACFVCILAGSAALPAFGRNDVPDGLVCTTCKWAAGVIGPLLRGNRSVTDIEEIAKPICELIHGGDECQGHWQCQDLCRGIIREFAPEFVQLYTAPHIGPEEVCAGLKACPPRVIPPGPAPGIQGIRSNLSDFSGEKPWVQWKRPNTGLGKILHLTDIHLDLTYAEGSNPLCGQPLCCRAVDGPPAAGQRAAGKFGDYECDTPPATAESLWATVKAKFASEVDFAIITGDEPPHDVWNQSQPHNLQAIDAVNAGALTALSDVPTLPCLGNHAAYPVNQYEGPGKDSWLYNAVANDWAHWLPDDALRTLRYGGFYAARARPGLRVISMHTTILCDMDYYTALNLTIYDVSGQIPWVNDTLRQARELGEKVIFIGHTRPTGWMQPFQDAFFPMFQAYSDIIVGYLYGHAHSAPLNLMRDAVTEKPFAVSYTAGSITTYQDLNPGFRQWDYNRTDNELTGWGEYWMNLTDANLHPDEAPEWPLRYHAPEDFNMTSLSPDQWADFANRLLVEPELFELWTAAYFKGGPRIFKRGAQEAADEILDLPSNKSASATQGHGHRH